MIFIGWFYRLHRTKRFINSPVEISLQPDQSTDLIKLSNGAQQKVYRQNQSRWTQQHLQVLLRVCYIKCRHSLCRSSVATKRRKWVYLAWIHRRQRFRQRLSSIRTTLFLRQDHTTRTAPMAFSSVLPTPAATSPAKHLMTTRKELLLPYILVTTSHYSQQKSFYTKVGNVVYYSLFIRANGG